MNIQDQRRALFEPWVKGRKVVTRYGAKLEWNPAGNCYRDYRINDRWIAWNAALDSVVVELPRLAEGYAEHLQTHAQSVFLEALEDAGLRATL